MAIDLIVPSVTAALPGIGGRLKSRAEDFVVEELPAYDPCGAGEHLWLWLEKRELSAAALLDHLARALDVPRRDIGCAGMKDRTAVTHQWLSVPARAEPRLAAVETDRVRVLGATRHREKLRTGQLAGNRFDVLLREVHPQAEARAAAILAELTRVGLPNSYGAQRFGHGGGNVTAGLALLAGERCAPLVDAAPDRRGFLRRLYLSAVQSWLFNLTLGHRLADGLFGEIIAGDLVQHPRLGGCYVAHDLAAANRELAAHTLVHTGPMFGPKMPEPRARAREREAAVLAEAGLRREAFAAHAKLAAGTRRANLIWLGPVALRREAEGLRLGFTLPRGVYATVLLGELIKSPAVDDPDAACESETPCDR